MLKLKLSSGLSVSIKAVLRKSKKRQVKKKIFK